MNFIKNIIRVIQWAPIIWRDRDFDYNFLLNLMDYKLERMARHFETHRFIAHWSHVRLKIHTARHLLELTREDPDDEWYKVVNAGASEISMSLTRKSADRELRNWRNFWRYMEKNAGDMWD